MRKWGFWIMLVILLAVFVVSAGKIISILYQYKVGEQFYEEATSQFVRVVDPDDPDSDGVAPNPYIGSYSELIKSPEFAGEISEETQSVFRAPIQVDFAALKAINPDIVGWLYCEGTIINYPVLQGSDDDYYLHRSYDRSYLYAGSIFMEAQNQPDFRDVNTIIYGHNMKDNTMFASLQNWSDPSFYQEHPFIWLLTPEQDYLIAVFSGYTTSSTSDAYQLFSEYGDEFDEYVEDSVQKSDFSASFDPDSSGQFVLLSTCSYVYDNARYVIHGQLFPVDRVAAH